MIIDAKQGNKGTRAICNIKIGSVETEGVCSEVYIRIWVSYNTVNGFTIDSGNALLTKRAKSWNMSISGVKRT